MSKINQCTFLVIFILCILFSDTAAFAAASRHTSAVLVSNIDAEADGKEKVLIEINLSNGTKDTVFIGTDRGSADKFWVKKDKTWVSVASLSEEAGDEIYYISKKIVKARIDGSLELGLTSTAKGKVQIGVSLKGERELDLYLSGHASATEAEIIPVKYNDTSKTLADTRYSKITVETESEEKYVTYTENKVYVNVLNKSNNIAGIDEDIKSFELNAEVLNKPAKAKVILEKSPAWETELRDTGSTYLTLQSDQPGEIDLDVNLKLKYKNSFSPDAMLNSAAKLNIIPKQFGAGEIQLFLNQDTATVDNQAHKLTIVPFIQDSRTFVPVRFLAEALGAEVNWAPETQTIVLSRPDRMITMTIGNSALLLDNGKVVLSDAAPFIKDGFTVLPFRAIAEAFGAEVAAGYTNTGEIDRIYFYNQ
ncbi:MAG: copper amine oxidase N-terminal domain-containing protein [Peptococcaceae bacterium]